MNRINVLATVSHWRYELGTEIWVYQRYYGIPVMNLHAGMAHCNRSAIKDNITPPTLGGLKTSSW